MPYRTALKRRRNYRKRAGRYVRGSRSRRSSALRRRRIPRTRRLPLTGFPKSKMVRLRYVEQVSLNPGVNGVDSYYFRANDMYDPNFTGTGHQPLGFDQWLGRIYDHFTVVGAKVKVTPVQQGYDATGTNSCMFGVLLDDNSTFTYTNGPQILESKQGKGAVLIGNPGTGAGNKPKSAYRNFSSNKFFGTKNIVGKDLYRGGATFSPTEDAFFGLWAASVGGNDPDLLNFLVEIEYIAVLTEPRFLPQS